MVDGVTGLRQQPVQLPAVLEHLSKQGHALIQFLIPAANIVKDLPMTLMEVHVM